MKIFQNFQMSKWIFYCFVNVNLACLCFKASKCSFEKFNFQPISAFSTRNEETTKIWWKYTFRSFLFSTYRTQSKPGGVFSPHRFGFHLVEIFVSLLNFGPNKFNEWFKLVLWRQCAVYITSVRVDFQTRIFSKPEQLIFQVLSYHTSASNKEVEKFLVSMVRFIL